MSEPALVIRKFRQIDKPQVRRIAYETAFMGEPASIFFEGEAIISDLLTLYYTDYEPQSLFLAQAPCGIVGSLIGAKNKIGSEKIFMAKIFPLIFRKALSSGVFLKKKNILLLANLLLSILKGEFKTPDFSKQYPATFHINIKKGYRGLNAGSLLISAYLDYLAKENISGVHLATMSEDAAKFFSSRGFSLLYSAKRSYFSHILGKDVPLYIYGRRL